MLVVLVGIVALGAFLFLSQRAIEGYSSARAAAAIEAFVLIGFALMGLLVGLLLLGIRCDEACNESLVASAQQPEWWHTEGAWQWVAQFLAAALGFAAVVTGFVQTVRRRHRGAQVAMVVAALSFGAWAAFMAPLGNAFGI